ncbi:MAG: trypsin-like serine protease [Ruminococcaceae bacterium]|nr:trypsin-like serine protease [Oscillospiraceae bacterium]
MDELNLNLNTPQPPVPPVPDAPQPPIPPPSEEPREVVLHYAAETPPQEVVLRYVAPAPQEVVLRYTAPAPEASAELSELFASAFMPAIVPARRGGRKGLWIFLSSLGLLFLLSAALGILYWKDILPRRTAEAQAEADNYRYNFEWRSSIDDYANAETTLKRYPTGGDARLHFAESHGAALNIQEVYERVNPCTVTIATALPGGGAIIGTGVIFTPDGYILTNAHVITGGEKCYVVLDNGTSFDDAKLVGFDAEKDLAVIKVDAKMLPTAEFGDSDALTVGDTVYAIGNPLGVELRGTLTDGIVSAINRDVNVDGVKMTLIQTNAALNNGNSGGPLINVYGQVVGINTMKMGSSSTVSVEGLGFAIPVSSAAWMINDLVAYGEIRGEPVLGISVLREAVILPTGESALRIYEIEAGSAAAKTELLNGDLIVRADSEPIGSVSDLLRVRRRFAVGETLTLEIDRDGERMNIDVVLEASAH